MAAVVVTVLLLLLVGSLCLEIGGQPPHFVEEPAQVDGFRKYVFEVDEQGRNANLTLNCKADGDPSLRISWYLNGEVLDASYVQDTGSLVIENITEGEFASRDGIHYHCTATNTFGIIRSRAATVYYAYFDGFEGSPDTLTEVTVNVSLHSDGGDVALSCNVTDAKPPPEIVWYYEDGSQISSGNNPYYQNGGQYLVIFGLTTADINHRYRCGVTNARLYHKVLSNITYSLNDLDSSFPDFVVYKHLENKTVLVGDTAEFTVVAGAANRVLYGYSLIPRRPIDLVAQVLAVVENVELPEDGKMTYEVSCQLQVFGGASLTETATLTVQESVRITEYPADDFEQFSGDNVTQTCLFSGVPDPTITWYFNGEILREGNGIMFHGSSLTITGTTVDHSGMYQCIVSNDVNTEQASWALRIRDPELSDESITGAPEDCRPGIGRVFAGERATILIQLLAYPCPNVTWMVNGTELDLANNMLQIPNNPCSNGTTGTYKFTLTITNVTQGFGNYSAYLKNRAGNITTDVILITPEVPVQEVNIVLAMPKEPPCLVGQSEVHIRCETTGYPQPTISFFKDTQEITFDDRVMLVSCDELMITAVVQEDEGTYACTANNSANEDVRRAEMFYQYCISPSITDFVVSDSDPAVGDDILLECCVDGTPLPDVEWWKDEKRISPNERISISTKNDFMFVLTINDTTAEDGGVYTCLASNIAGETEEENTITVEPISDSVTPSETTIFGLNIAAVISIVVGSFVIVICILITACIFFGAKYQKQGPPSPVHRQPQLNPLVLQHSQDYSVDTSSTSPVLLELLPQNMVIPFSQLQLRDTIGQGEFSIVYKAYYVPHQSKTDLVAVKTLKGLFTCTDAQSLVKEVMKLQTFDHPHVMSLLGVCLDGGGGPAIIMPFMARGSLLNYLRRERKSLVLPKEADVTDVSHTQRMLLSICWQISKGMEYLVQQNVVHRDLAARNCMMDERGVIKVADFGLAEDIYSRNYFRWKEHNSNAKLPVKWLALESLLSGVFSEKTDVWAFGVTCWEIFTGGAIPYGGISPMALPQLFQNGERLPKPQNVACSDQIYDVMLSCWKVDPDERPEFSDLVLTTSSMLHSLAEYLDLSLSGCDQKQP